MDDLNFINQAENNNKDKFISTWNIKKQNKEITKIHEEAIKQKSKEEVQSEIMSYFIQNPENNITIGMSITKDPIDWYEIIDFWNAKDEDDNLNQLFNWAIKTKVIGLKLKADETWEQWEEFSKELVIDRKTNKKWMLLIWKKWFNIDQVDFEDITKYDVPYETYFVYKEEWQTYVRLIKNELANVQLKSKDWKVSWEMEFPTDWLKGMTPEIFQQLQEQLVGTLKSAKNNWTLDITIDMLLSQMPVPEETKSFLKNEFYTLAES